MSTMTGPFPYVERGVKLKVVHPQYNFFTYESDIALLQLDQSMDLKPHVNPICLPPDNMELEGVNGTVIGWGRLNEGGMLPSVLQEITLPLVSNENCTEIFLKTGRKEYIPDVFICAGLTEGGKDACVVSSLFFTD